MFWARLVETQGCRHASPTQGPVDPRSGVKLFWLSNQDSQPSVVLFYQFMTEYGPNCPICQCHFKWTLITDGIAILWLLHSNEAGWLSLDMITTHILQLAVSWNVFFIKISFTAVTRKMKMLKCWCISRIFPLTVHGQGNRIGPVCVSVCLPVSTFCYPVTFCLCVSIGLSPSCAPWRTMQVGGAQCRSMMHNVVLYSLGAHQPRQTDGTNSFTLTADVEGNKSLQWIPRSVTNLTSWSWILKIGPKTIKDLFTWHGFESPFPHILLNLFFERDNFEVGILLLFVSISRSKLVCHCSTYWIQFLSPPVLVQGGLINTAFGPYVTWSKIKRETSSCVFSLVKVK